ncbi:MAG TPA: decaprenyl-phosphate phosphoribosyltransferase [Candidatus Aminicenantes bacterium]|nr:decaprenyl-phosphate phosphoribosyltransferase [Candidatus Aminicenantes bacterium]
MLKRFSQYFTLLRPHQWVKNSIVFAPLIFSRHFLEVSSVLKTLLTFFGFSLLASASYVLNDMVDREKDRIHPVKRNRPLASGSVSLKEALILLFLCLGAGTTILLLQARGVVWVGLAYFLMVTLYSFFLKSIVILDILIIAIGFDLRAFIGSLAIGVTLSPWLIISVFLLALFLASTKRRQELVKLDGANQHKRVLSFYSPALLDQMVSILASTTLIAYTLYTLAPVRGAVKREGEELLFLTVPFVVYGIFRYLYLIYKKNDFGDPTDTLLKDLPLLIDLGLWGITTIVLLYFVR